MRSRCSTRSRFAAATHLFRPKPAIRLTDAATVYMTKILANRGFSSLTPMSIPFPTVKLMARSGTDTMVTQAMVSLKDVKTTAYPASAGVVQQVQEVVAEAAPCHRGDRDQGHIHGNEPENPAPHHGPVRGQPVVNVSVVRH